MYDWHPIHYINQLQKTNKNMFFYFLIMNTSLNHFLDRARFLWQYNHVFLLLHEPSILRIVYIHTHKISFHCGSCFREWKYYICVCMYLLMLYNKYVILLYFVSFIELILEKTKNNRYWTSIYTSSSSSIFLAKTGST